MALHVMELQKLMPQLALNIPSNPSLFWGSFKTKNMKVILFLALVGLFSCTQKNISEDSVEYFTLSSFPVSKNIESKKYFYPEILTPHILTIKNGKVVLASIRGENLIHIIDQKTMEYLVGKGNPGEGPDEIMNVWEFDMGFNENTIWAYSNTGKSFYEFDLSDSSKSAVSKIRQSGDWIQGMSMNWVKRNEIISYMNFSDNKFIIFDSLGKEISKAGPWSTTAKISDESKFVLSDLNQGSKSINRDKLKLVLAKVKFDEFEIFDLNNQTIKVLKGPVNKEFNYTIQTDGNVNVAIADENSVYGYNNSYITENYIFLVFIGKTRQQLGESKETSRDIFQFDLEGNPIAHFETNVSIRSIAVDEKQKKIYAITEDREPGIAVFEY
jgi:hypothetical protein